MQPSGSAVPNPAARNTTSGFPPLPFAAIEPTQRELRHWHAVSVRHQHEQRAASLLEQRGVPSLVPTYGAERQWSDRIKQVQLPLFAGYVFCQFDARQRTQVEDTPGVIRIVQFGSQPAPIPDAEMAAIKALMDPRLPRSPWPFLRQGDRVRIERGPLRGLEGILVEDKGAERNGGYRLVVGVELLQRSVAVEVDARSIVPSRVVA